MNLDDIKDRLLSTLTQLWEKIQESSIYTQLRDRYENLTPQGQKLTLASLIIFVLLIILSIPFSSLTNSSNYVTEFEDKRNIIRELLKVTRDASDVPQLSIAPTPDRLRIQIDEMLRARDLLPEQIQNVAIATADSDLIPKNLSQGGIQIQLGQLNLNQLLEITHSIQSINASVKLKDLTVRASANDPHYFDVTMKLIALAIPEPPAQMIDDEPKKNRKKNKVINESEE